jgi:hypothetical protein
MFYEPILARKLPELHLLLYKRIGGNPKEEIE